MIRIELEPCPLCGGEAMVEQLTATSKFIQSGTIKCTACGLTLRWETPNTEAISRSGIKHVQIGMDPIEAWNRRSMCDACGHKIHSEQVAALHNCNDCGAAHDCEYIPKLGEMARINCPLWRPQEHVQSDGNE